VTQEFLHNDPALIACVSLALFLPLLSFLFSWLTPARYSWLAGLNAPLLLLVSAICSIILLFSQWNNPPQVFQVAWFSVGTLSFTADIALSNTSLLMLTIVSGISFLVHLFSAGYMIGDQNIKKYFAMLGFFTFSMQGIVLSNNLLVLFVFWELVGFSSYMLIGHWAEKPLAANAATKAFIMNRIGDAGFLVGLMMIWSNTGSFNIGDLNTLGLNSWNTAASLFIFCGVMGKSAQFPLFTWLPDAMEGPTPVSALIHAATMVAAGVYLCIRLSFVFTADSLFIVTCVGALTAIVGASSALFQFDIKRVLAFSTISQLGLMMMAIGLGVVNAAMLHLFTHAFFKACLFLCAGSVIHSLHEAQLRSTTHVDVQDIRNMGGLRSKLPTTFFAFLLAAASLGGIPFFSGFLSKEAILAAAWSGHGFMSWVFLITMLGVSFLTVLYTVRLTWYVFMGEPRKISTLDVREVPIIMRIPVIILGALSLWLVVSWNPFDAVGWLLPKETYTHFPGLTLFSFFWIGIAVIIGYLIFKKASFYQNSLLSNAFFVDRLYATIVSPAVNFVAHAAESVDKKVIDRVIHSGAYAHVITAHMTGWFDKFILDGIVNGFASLARTIGSFTRSFQGGKIQLYIFWSIFALIIFLIWTLK
jgi:NADH-quinone oxidoreductase subunit L